MMRPLVFKISEVWLIFLLFSSLAQAQTHPPPGHQMAMPPEGATAPNNDMGGMPTAHGMEGMSSQSDEPTSSHDCGDWAFYDVMTNMCQRLSRFGDRDWYAMV